MEKYAMNDRPNLILAARCAGDLVAELLNPFNNGLSADAVTHIRDILSALRIDTLTVRDNAVLVAARAESE